MRRVQTWTSYSAVYRFRSLSRQSVVTALKTVYSRLAAAEYFGLREVTFTIFGLGL